MRRFLACGGGMGVGVVIWAALAVSACGDETDEDRLAKRLLTAAEKHAELQDVVARYGQRAQMAQEILWGQETRIDLVAQIRNLDAMMSGFPQNRRLWLPDQWAVLDQKVACDRQLAALDHRLGTLRLQESRMYEQELQAARAENRPVKPLNREALLSDLQRLERERNGAVVELKDGIEATARKKRTTPRQVLDGAVARLDRWTTSKSPDVERDFLPRFKRYAGGDAWLDKGKAPAARPKKDAPRPKKDAPRAKKDAPQATKAGGF